MHTLSLNKPKKFKQTFARKLMETVSCNRKGELMVEFMQQGTTIMSHVHLPNTKKNYVGPFINKGVECLHLV
jgi:hypothetical protein